MNLNLPNGVLIASSHSDPRRGAGWAMVLGILVTCIAGCGRGDRMRVELTATAPQERDARQLIVQAQVSGPLDRLSYRWFSESGECVPQRSDTPNTVFSFGEAKLKDRIVVEVWRDNQPVARGELAVTRSAGLSAADGGRPRKIQIEVSDIPPYDPRGGPNTRAHIGGSLSGDVEPGLVVVIYARAHSTWFVQPDPTSKHFLRSDRSFSTRTHTGSEYAILVTRIDFNPIDATEVLPLADKDVVAHVIVEGEKQ